MSRLFVGQFAGRIIVDDVWRVFCVIWHRHCWLVTVAIALIDTDNFDASMMRRRRVDAEVIVRVIPHLHQLSSKYEPGWLFTNVCRTYATTDVVRLFVNRPPEQ